jgi:hypothetical protein
MAVVGPAAVFAADVEPALVNRILNDMGPDPNQLPVLQHALMRMWTYEGTEQQTPHEQMAVAAAGAEAYPAHVSGRRTLTTADYEAVGGLSNALSNHADEVFDTLTQRQQCIAEKMFRRLSLRTQAARDIRRPAAVEEIAAIAEADIEEVIAVADAFRQPEHSFILPPASVPLRPESALDITH